MPFDYVFQIPDDVRGIDIYRSLSLSLFDCMSFLELETVMVVSISDLERNTDERVVENGA